MKSDLFAYCLHLADNSLILGQRNSEWTGHGPVLEQDIALTNIALDLLGQARNCYQYAAELLVADGETGVNEDTLALTYPCNIMQRVPGCHENYGQRGRLLKG